MQHHSRGLFRRVAGAHVFKARARVTYIVS